MFIGSRADYRDVSLVVLVTSCMFHDTDGPADMAQVGLCKAFCGGHFQQ